MQSSDILPVVFIPPRSNCILFMISFSAISDDDSQTDEESFQIAAAKHIQPYAHDDICVSIPGPPLLDLSNTPTRGSDSVSTSNIFNPIVDPHVQEIVPNFSSQTSRNQVIHESMFQIRCLI